MNSDFGRAAPFRAFEDHLNTPDDLSPPVEQVQDPFQQYRFNPLELCREMERRGLRLAKWKSTEEMLDRRRKVLRARKMKEFIAGGDAIGKAEVKAEAHPEYTEVVNGLLWAIKKHAEAKVLYDSWVEYIGLIRTANATARAEMNLGGFST